MKTRNYNIYIFISTFIRNIIDIYSVIYLYRKGIVLKDIILIYAIVYFLGIFISGLSINIGYKIGYKYILIISSIITGITFYIINNSNNIYLIAISLSLSTFTYHPIRHYYGINILKDKKHIGNTLILTYIATILSSYIVINNIKIIYLIILSIINIIPAIFLTDIKEKKNKTKITKYKLNFFILDQFKIVFILLQPLYLYMISISISYIGIFNIILTISSIIYTYILTNKIKKEDIIFEDKPYNIWDANNNIDDSLEKKKKKNYKYINIIFCITLLLKINITNKIILLILAFLEGMGVKSNELVSTINLYSSKNPNKEYIINCEKIFCLIRTFLLSIIYFISNIKISLYILITGIFLLGFQYKKDTI